jgi:solute carrier family 31 (copper transporter), member 1
MVFNLDTDRICVVFKSWRINGPVSMIFSLLAIVALTAGYELVRELSRRVEVRHAAQLSAYGTSGSGTHYAPLRRAGPGTKWDAKEMKQAHSSA